jgi:hypothetical protein
MKIQVISLYIPDQVEVKLKAFCICLGEMIRLNNFVLKVVFDD